jgi:hypothetical protein
MADRFWPSPGAVSPGDLGRGRTIRPTPEIRKYFCRPAKFPYLAQSRNKVWSLAMQETCYFKGFLWLPNRASPPHALIDG